LSRILLMAGITVGAVAAWLALDPPAPRDVDAFSSLPPAAKTGAPGDGLCTECHTGVMNLNDGVGSVTIGGVPDPYTPTQTYTLTVTVRRTVQEIRWGFELVPLKSSNNSGAGTLANTTLLTATQPFGSRTYISHTTFNPGHDGTFEAQPDSATWTFTWTAPAAGAGAVTFYAAGNAANGNGFNSGDHIYTTSVSSMETSSTDVEATTWGKIKMLYR
jgi:hypothetical protein